MHSLFSGNFLEDFRIPRRGLLQIHIHLSAASPILQRIPPASEFRKNSFFQFSGRSPSR